MAKTISIELQVTGKDTTDIVSNNNISNFLQLTVADFAVTDSVGMNPLYDNTLSASAITPSILGTSGATKIQCVAKMVYNVAEAAPFVTFTVDGEAVEGGHMAAFLFDTSLAVTTTNLSNPVKIQFAFYPMY